MAAMTPTQLTLRHLRADGYVAEVVERRVPGRPGTRPTTRDLFGFGDVLAIRPGEVLLVQTTTSGNASARVRKIADAELVGAVREAGIGIHVHGWRKDKATRRWVPRIIDCS